jgi:hypothetical protein
MIFKARCTYTAPRVLRNVHGVGICIRWVTSLVERVVLKKYQGNVFVHIPESSGNAEPIAWIVDFGLSTDNGEVCTFPGHECYRAPEIDPRITYTVRKEDARKMENGDVYSFGWTIFTVCNSLLQCWSEVLTVLSDADRYRF